ncbi:MAG: redoxin domain-containing protein [Nitrosomonadales bacterium]|jgi:thiol-disulfide isomerase/thioredoxin|nr:MAG: redoxin domain-containing protein [Nitrosomonadales bacterium]
MLDTTTTNHESLAPELQTSGWLNTSGSITLASLLGKVVVLHSFQMLCPGCVQVGIPQAQRIYEEFDPEQVAVIGLHTVFEHHSVMGRDALEVFVHEYRIRFPIGIDKHDDQQQRLPLTMHAYQMQGTPTLILIDKAGQLRLHKFGHISDLTLGFSIGTLLSEKIVSTETPKEIFSNDANCDENGCRL